VRNSQEADLTSADGKATGERELRALMDNLAQAIRSRDADALMAHYAADVLAFDLLPPLQYRGADAVRKRVSEWFSSFEGSIGFEMRNLNIAAGDGIAFCYSLNGVSGTNMRGEKIDMWWRATNCFRKVDGKWLVVHAHSSEPFDMQSGKALLDLKP
jgi:ketosteroid isomerase-like protein